MKLDGRFCSWQNDYLFGCLVILHASFKKTIRVFNSLDLIWPEVLSNCLEKFMSRR